MKDPVRSAIPNLIAHRRPSAQGWSMVVLMALTVQLSISMLEFAGPGSIETRTRLATTIVAAAHRGVFTEPDRPQGDLKVGRRGPERPAPAARTHSTVALDQSISAAVSPWSMGLAPPLA